jgi:nitric oxide reductase subunit B
VVTAKIQLLLKTNRYNSRTRALAFTDPESESYERQIAKWKTYLVRPGTSAGLPANYINNAEEIRQPTAFFAWTAWASVTDRPGKSYSYTNNFPYDPAVGNTPSSDAVLWSALSLITLLGALALALFVFGRFDFLGWKGKTGHVHPQLIPGAATETQRAILKYFVVVALLFLGQVLVGGTIAHYRADPASFYGIDFSRILPSHIARTWHLQLAIFWVATAYVAGGLFPGVCSRRDRTKRPSQGSWIAVWRPRGRNFWKSAGRTRGRQATARQPVVLVWGSGLAYLDLGRAWQIILALGLVFWLILLRRAVAPAFECVNFAKSHASSVRRVSGTTSIAEKTAARAIVMLDWPVQYQ